MNEGLKEQLKFFFNKASQLTQILVALGLVAGAAGTSGGGWRGRRRREGQRVEQPSESSASSRGKTCLEKGFNQDWKP